MDFLREQWAIDRRAEWSIWMVHSKVEMPHQYISSDIDSSSYHGSRGRAPVLRKISEDVSIPTLLIFYNICHLFFLFELYLCSLTKFELLKIRIILYILV